MPQNPRHSHRRNIPANATRTHTHTKTRKPRAPVSHARNDGVKLTALAFGTLLSSQETDAFTEPTRNRNPDPGVRGAPFRLSNSADFPPPVKPAFFRPAPAPGHPQLGLPASRATPLT